MRSVIRSLFPPWFRDVHCILMDLKRKDGFYRERDLREWLALLRREDRTRQLSGGWREVRLRQAPLVNHAYIGELPLNEREVEAALGVEVLHCPDDQWDDAICALLSPLDHVYRLKIISNSPATTNIIAESGREPVELGELLEMFARWTVWRQDDHGNRFEVSTVPGKRAADQLCDELEARGHKQTYWVERAKITPTTSRSSP